MQGPCPEIAVARTSPCRNGKRLNTLQCLKSDNVGRGDGMWRHVKTLQIYRSHMVPVKTQWRWQDLSRFDELDQPDMAKSFRGDLFTGRGGTLDLCRVSNNICTWRDIDGKEIVAEDFSLMTQLVWWDGHDTAHCVCIWDQMKNIEKHGSCIRRVFSSRYGLSLRCNVAVSQLLLSWSRNHIQKATSLSEVEPKSFFCIPQAAQIWSWIVLAVFQLHHCHNVQFSVAFHLRCQRTSKQRNDVYSYHQLSKLSVIQLCIVVLLSGTEHCNGRGAGDFGSATSNGCFGTQREGSLFSANTVVARAKEKFKVQHTSQGNG